MLAETIYKLRRKNGLSQEQLAEQLGVSRQTISKWEQGTTVPEGDKLLALGRYFQVSLDELVGESRPQEKKEPEPDRRSAAGLVLSLAGVVGLLLWGLMTLFAPRLSQELSEASAVELNGSGLFLLACAGAVAAGAALLLRRKK